MDRDGEQLCSQEPATGFCSEVHNYVIKEANMQSKFRKMEESCLN
jgi:hypothetical protein